MSRGGKGIIIIDRGQGRWQYRVLDRSRSRYRTRTFVRGPEDENRKRTGCGAGDTWATQLSASFTLGQDGAGRCTLADLMAAYIDHRTHQGRSESHLRGIRNACRIATEAGVCELHASKIPEKITRHLASLLAKRKGQRTAQPASVRTKNHVVVVLRAMGRFAVKRDLLAKDPFAALETLPEQRRYRSIYTIPELRVMISYRHRQDSWWLFATLAAYTGMRSATLRALTWGMADFDANVLRIPAAIMKAGNDCRIPLQQELKDVLQSLHRESPHSPILGNEIAKMSSGDANLHMARYQARLGIAREGRSIHTFRHSVAGMLTATGQVPFLVMDALGHRTVSTSKYYSNLASEYQRIIAAERWPVGVLLLRKTSLGAK